MRRIVSSLLLLASLAGAARADFEAGYFPLARGDAWVYRDAAGSEREVRCDSVQTFGGAKQFRLRDHNGSSHRARESAAGRVSVGTTRTWYRFDAAVGATWTLSITGGALPGSNGARLQVVSRSEMKVFAPDGALLGDADLGVGADALTGLAVTPDGRLLVLDARGGRVLEVGIAP